MTLGLSGKYVYLAASFPSGDRAREWPEADAGAIAEAVTATVRTVLGIGGRLLFGGHPTITPLVLLIATEHGVSDRVDVFQSSWFAREITPAVRRLEKIGVGRVHMTARGQDLDESLAIMRHEMFATSPVAGAVFVGGMEGIPEEYERVVHQLPGVPRLAVAGPGGAAATLTTDVDVPDRIRELLRESRAYPFVMAEAVAYLARRQS